MDAIEIKLMPCQKDYISHLLLHVNQYTGLTYAEDPTIFAYETGNEMGGPTFGIFIVFTLSMHCTNRSKVMRTFPSSGPQKSRYAMNIFEIPHYIVLISHSLSLSS